MRVCMHARVRVCVRMRACMCACVCICACMNFFFSYSFTHISHPALWAWSLSVNHQQTGTAILWHSTQPCCSSYTTVTDIAILWHSTQPCCSSYAMVTDIAILWHSTQPCCSSQTTGINIGTLGHSAGRKEIGSSHPVNYDVIWGWRHSLQYPFRPQTALINIIILQHSLQPCRQLEEEEEDEEDEEEEEEQSFRQHCISPTRVCTLRFTWSIKMYTLSLKHTTYCIPCTTPHLHTNTWIAQKEGNTHREGELSLRERADMLVLVSLWNR